MANFFIRRPIFAWVLAIILMMAGALAILQLPVAQYPTIAPPAVSVSANYPGADAQTVQDTVTQVIEQNMNGIDNLMYMSSTSDSAGSVTITLTFQSGTDPDIAQVQVQNKLQLATPLLPQEVQQQGISVEKSSSSYLMVAGFVSDNPDTTQDDISDYVASNVKDTLSRLNSVGDVQLFGAQYAMRIWLDADLLNKYKLTPVDVINQLKVQNAQIAAGQLGGTPALPGQQLNASIIAQTRLKNPEEFGKVTLRVNSDGSVVRLKDVARVELGGENYNVIARINGKPAAGLGIKLATGANALDTAKAIKAKLAELQPFFPQGMKVLYPYDTTPFVQLSIHEVVKTLFEAIMLVFLVMYLFLQNMRATLIPTIAVPVVLLGTFAILAAFGYSINTLTMFGMVLAIGLLVDDAIVVVENVERVMMEDKLPPKEATEKSMSQIQGALVGIAMVLSAVFIPMAFFGGSTGAIYRQFSITIVSAMALSVLVALILTPALCATLLKPTSAEHHENKGGFFGWFNTTFDHSVNHYTNSVGKILGSTGRYLLIYALIVAGMVVLFLRLPSSFLPEEDQGVFLTMIQLPAGATLDAVQKKGFVQCGISDGLPGFSYADADGKFSGIDVDVCRGVAAAVFGDDTKVKYTPLTAKERFTALQSGEVDLLSRNTTWTSSRDAGMGMAFTGVTYYDGIGFLTHDKAGLKSAKELDGATVCIQAGTDTELNVADYFKANNMKYTPVTFDRSDESAKALESGRCDTLASDQSQLYALRIKLSNPAEWIVLPEVISKEPLGPVVRRGDDEWFSIVRWTLFAMLNAEEMGINSQNVDEKAANPATPDMAHLLGKEGDYGKDLKLDNKWAYNIIKQVGNYSEIFERNVGSESPLKIKRGQNNLWNNGGIQYAPPVR
ncbi:efflux RND transporter permease subunit [Escherichia coli]|nr:efflux RND transporter permease subunit [Escherichia coli]EFC0570032.1 efflux RND transporter permease subunit [Escherichia coli O157:H7]EEC9726152.1 efflux RND transporter permease subunit [Escherichia coli]EEG9508840.1 efflux RND transporter permease subunit [Escherichia coli]EEQ4473054.1 efflux RND transporter permease subunit [Escherichia coli]